MTTRRPKTSQSSRRRVAGFQQTRDRLIRLVSPVAVLILVIAPSESALADSDAPTYSVTNLGALPGGEEAIAYDLNAAGQVAGHAQYDTVRHFEHATKWTDGQVEDLGVLVDTALTSHGFAVNDLGHVVGVSGAPGGFSMIPRAFLHDGVNMINLGSLAGVASLAYDVNNSDQVVGLSDNGDTGAGGEDVYHAFLWQNGHMTDLGPPGAEFSQAVAINESGHIVGSSMADGFPVHAFLKTDGDLQDIGTLGGAASEAWDINDNDQVVGWAHDANGAPRAFVYENGAMADIGALPGAVASKAYGVSNLGWIVGTSWVAGEGPHAFLRTDATMVDLNQQIPPDSGWMLQVARDVNDCGLIVGYGRYNGRRRAFLLTPIPTCPGDLDWDDDVDTADLFSLLANYGAAQDACYMNGDLDGDGDIDLADLGLFLAVFGDNCQ